MGVGRRRTKTWNLGSRTLIWMCLGVFIIQGSLAETSKNETTDANEGESDEVEVVSLVKKDKRQAQRGYTDVPLDQGPFDELTASSPSPIAFENDLPTFVDSLSDIADATPADYNNKFSDRYGPTSSEQRASQNQGFPENIDRSSFITIQSSPSTPVSSSSPVPSVFSNTLGPITNLSRPTGFISQKQISVALNNGVPFGPVSNVAGLADRGLTPSGTLTDSLALPDNTAAAANIERRQAELPVTPNEPPPFNGKAIPGEAGIDYPIYGEIPRTQFSCKDQAWPGYYADPQARCQVFWICQKHRMDGFLCPNGTLFNQQVFVCDWWFNVDCSAAPEFYSRNQFVYAGPGIGIDGQPVRGLSLPIAATNRVANILPPLPPPIRNNALLTAPSSGQGTQVQSSNQVARVATPTPRPADFQSRADSLNNFFKSSQSTTGSGQSYQSQLVSRLQSNPNRLHDTVSIVKGSTGPPRLPLKDNDRRIPSASSQTQITQTHVSGTSRPTIVSSYHPQHVETVSIVSTPNPTTRPTTARPPPPPIPKFNISPTPKPIKGPSPSPFGNVIKLGTTVTISTTHRPDYNTKTSLFKGIISSTAKPSKSGVLKLSNTNLLGSNSQPTPVSFNRPPPSSPTGFIPRQISTEDPNNTIRPPDYSPQRAPDPSPAPHFSGPGYLPQGKSHQKHFFPSGSSKLHGAHGMRSNQFSNVHGQRENIYASSRKDTFIEFPYSPSQQKHKQKLAELAANKDIGGSKVVTPIPHFYGQRSNVYSGAESLSFVSNNNKKVVINHTNYSQRQGPFVKTTSHGKPHQHPSPHPSGKPDYASSSQNIPQQHQPPNQQFQQHQPPNQPFHQPPPSQHFQQQHHNQQFQQPTPQHIQQHSTPQPFQHQNPTPPQFQHPPPSQHFQQNGQSPPIPQPSPAQQFHEHPAQRLQVPQPQPTTIRPPQHFLDHTQGPSPSRPTPTFIPPPIQDQHRFQQELQVSPKPEQRFILTPSPTPIPQNFPSSTAQYHREVSPTPAGFQHPQGPPNFHSTPNDPFSRPESVTPRDGFTPLNAGSFISIQTSAAPFSQQILKHNSLQPFHDGHRTGGGLVPFSSTGPPPTPQQVIFSSPPTNNHNPGHFVSSTAAPRAFDHSPSPQNYIISSTQRPHINPSTAQPYYEPQGTPSSQPLVTTPYTTPNNFIAAPTQSPFHTTSPGHRQNPYLPHNHGKQKNKQIHRPPPPQQQHVSPSPTPLSASNPVTFPHGGITTTIKYPEGTGKLRLDFSGNGANRKNIVDFTYSAAPTSTTPSNYIAVTTPYPSSQDRFTQAVSSTTVRPHQASFPPPGSSGRGPGGRYAGAVTNKSNLSSSAIYVDTAAAAESAVTPITVPSPSSITPTASSHPAVSTSTYGLKLSATAKKRMTGAWQSYFSSKSE